MVGSQSVTDVLSRLVTDCVEVMNASAAAVLVTDNGGLALLISSSHGADQIEMLQVQSERGPCVDAIAADTRVTASGSDELRRRWGSVGEAIVHVGFTSVEAYPMHWRGRVVGGLNVFHTEAPDPDDDARFVGQALADVATIVLLHSTDIPADQISARVHEGVMARSVVEQAKGVLSYLHGVDMEVAYRQLRESAAAEGQPITARALSVVEEQHS